MKLIFCLLFLIPQSLASLGTFSLDVSISKQRLYLKQGSCIIKKYSISSSNTGIGNGIDSFCTPLGIHSVTQVIGADAPVGIRFKGGVSTKQITPIYSQFVPIAEQNDYIITRIFQLEGLEERNNNSAKRGIWIHGTPYEGNIGTRSSHGCIRMKNQDIIDLCPYIKKGTMVTIHI